MSINNGMIYRPRIPKVIRINYQFVHYYPPKLLFFNFLFQIKELNLSLLFLIYLPVLIALLWHSTLVESFSEDFLYLFHLMNKYFEIHFVEPYENVLQTVQLRELEGVELFLPVIQFLAILLDTLFQE